MNIRYRGVALGIFCGFVTICNQAQAFSYDDCMLQGLKGVSSDAAARMVKEACTNKRNEASRQEDQRLVAEYGEVDSSAVLAPTTKFYAAESSGFISKQYRYETKDGSKMITFVKLSVMDADKQGYCSVDSMRIYAYKLTLKPNSTANFFIKSNADSVCFGVEEVRTKPYKWTEFSLSSDIKPLDRDPFVKAVVLMPAAPAPALAPAPYYPSRR